MVRNNMEKISKYIIEKLKINKDSISKQPSVIDPYKITEYKGIPLGYETTSSIKNFINKTNIDLIIAYELLFKVLDKFENDLLDNYQIKLFYMNNKIYGFKFKNKYSNELLGYLSFSNNYKVRIKQKTGIGCFFIPASKDCANKYLAIEIRDWVGFEYNPFKDNN